MRYTATCCCKPRPSSGSNCRAQGYHLRRAPLRSPAPPCCCAQQTSMYVRRRVFCNRKPGLRLDTARWEEDAELLVLLFRKKTTSIYARSSCLPPCHLSCHLGPAQLDLSAISVQLNLYKLANRGHETVYIERKEESREKELRAVPVSADNVHSYGSPACFCLLKRKGHLYVHPTCVAAFAVLASPEAILPSGTCPADPSAISA